MIRTLKRYAKRLLPHRAQYLLRYGLVYRRLRGDGSACPICGYAFAEFLPYGTRGRRNALCPVCGSLERHRLQYLFLRARTNLFDAPLQVLHVAPERCFADLLTARREVTYVTCDLASPDVMHHWDITALPPADGTYDAILCSHVLEHVADDRRAMRELWRVLKPGGWALLDVPIGDFDHTREDPTITTPEGRLRAFGQADHVRFYGRDFPERLRAAGFTIEVIPFAQTLSDAEIRRYAVVPTQSIFLGRRPA